LDTTLTIAYNSIGSCQIFLHDYLDAINTYSIAFNLDSVEAAYLNNTGIAYAKLGDFKEAGVRLAKLERLQPDSCLPYRAWAAYFALMGEPETSVVNLEKAIDRGYKDWNWIKTEEALETIRNTVRYKTIMKEK
jgi:tetratricopeptide (TPR) repeat protein